MALPLIALMHACMYARMTWMLIIQLFHHMLTADWPLIATDVRRNGSHRLVASLLVWGEICLLQVVEASDITGRHLIEGVRSALLWAHGKPLENMHAGMSSGRMHATTGLVIIASQLHLISKAEQGEDQKPDGVSVISLGLKATRYVLTDIDQSGAIEYADLVLRCCHEADMACRRWPVDGHVEAFADGLVALARSVRAPRGKGTAAYLHPAHLLPPRRSPQMVDISIM